MSCCSDWGHFTVHHSVVVHFTHHLIFQSLIDTPLDTNRCSIVRSYDTHPFLAQRFQTSIDGQVTHHFHDIIPTEILRITCFFSYTPFYTPVGIRSVCWRIFTQNLIIRLTVMEMFCWFAIFLGCTRWDRESARLSGRRLVTRRFTSNQAGACDVRQQVDVDVHQVPVRSGDEHAGESGRVPQENWAGNREHHWRGARHRVVHEDDASFQWGTTDMHSHYNFLIIVNTGIHKSTHVLPACYQLPIKICRLPVEYCNVKSISRIIQIVKFTSVPTNYSWLLYNSNTVILKDIAQSQ